MTGPVSENSSSRPSSVRRTTISRQMVLNCSDLAVQEELNINWIWRVLSLSKLVPAQGNTPSQQWSVCKQSSALSLLRPKAAMPITLSKGAHKWCLPAMANRMRAPLKIKKAKRRNPSLTASVVNKGRLLPIQHAGQLCWTPAKRGSANESHPGLGCEWQVLSGVLATARSSNFTSLSGGVSLTHLPKCWSWFGVYEPASQLELHPMDVPYDQDRLIRC